MKFDLNVYCIDTTQNVQYTGIPAASLQEAVIEFGKRRKMLVIPSPVWVNTWLGIVPDETKWSDAELQEYAAYAANRGDFKRTHDCSYKGLYKITEATVFKW